MGVNPLDGMDGKNGSHEVGLWMVIGTKRFTLRALPARVGVFDER